MVDPANGIDCIADVAIASGIVAAVAASIDVSECSQCEVYDATGQIVCPGLVDTHVHVYDGVTPLGLDADTHCLSRGSTTVVDLGSAGCKTLPGFEKFAVRPSKTRILAAVHVAAHGLAAVPVHGGSGELDAVANVDVVASVKAVKEHLEEARDPFVIGIKIRLSQMVTDGQQDIEDEAFTRALQISEGTGLPLFVHHSGSSLPNQKVLQKNPNFFHVFGVRSSFSWAFNCIHRCLVR
eukprot:SAG31_NODE_1353_length_8663_cov_6.353690_5_plen_238_part_00